MGKKKPKKGTNLKIFKIKNSKTKKKVTKKGKVIKNAKTEIETSDMEIKSEKGTKIQEESKIEKKQKAMKSNIQNSL